MSLIYFPNNVATIMVALCWKNMFKLCTPIPGEGGPWQEEHNNITSYISILYNNWFEEQKQDDK